MDIKKVFASSLFVTALVIGQVTSLRNENNNSHHLYAEEESKVVSLETQDDLLTNYGYSATCYINSLEDLSALNISVYYDESIIEVTGYYNSGSYGYYDISNNNSAVNFAYLFTGTLPEGKTSLFYFYYRVKTDAPEGRYFFDVVINEAYDSSLSSVPVIGSRKYFNVSRPVQQKSTSFWGTNTLSTSIYEEFEIKYYISNREVASGAFNITYDNEYFEVVSVHADEFFENKLVDYNTNLAGTIYISFLSTDYSNNSNLFTIRFKTIKNETANQEIELVATELYDLDLDEVSSNKVQTNINIAYDSNFDLDIPIISVISSLEDNQISLMIRMTADTHLGAGDFVLTWDKDYLEYVSYQKEFTPSFFTVNTKEISDKKLKFSIISLTDIVDATDVLSITFNTLWHHDDESISFTITGSGLTDSLTNPISLNFVNCSQVALGSHNYGDWVTVTPSTYDEHGLEKHTCQTCGYEETRELPLLADDPNHYLASATNIATLHGREIEENGQTVVKDIAIRFGMKISKADWDAINTSWPINDYGVMLIKRTTLGDLNESSFIRPSYEQGNTPLVVNKGSGSAPYLDDNSYYSFTVKINITDISVNPNSHNVIFCALPFICAGGTYYFLNEMRYSVRMLAEYYRTNGGSTLSNAALNYLLAE